MSIIIVFSIKKCVKSIKISFFSIPAIRSRTIAAVSTGLTNNVPRVLPNIQTTNFSTLIQKTLINQHSICSNVYKSVLLNPKINELQSSLQVAPSRSVTKFSRHSGKRRTVKAVIKRFFRLNWGGWIRTKAGRHRSLWKKSPRRQMRLRQHVFCTAAQSRLLDSMVTKYWRKPKHWVDDPYEPYHTREDFYMTRQKPLFRE